MNSRPDTPVTSGPGISSANIESSATDRQARSVAAPDNPQVSINAKVLPPTSLVDVPNFPPKVPASSPRLPAADDVTESNWADGSQPQPWAKNARSSIF